MSYWTLLALPGALLVVLSHTEGDVKVAGPLVSLVWLAAGAWYWYADTGGTP